MRINLAQLEARLQSLIEGSAARLFPFNREQNELGIQLIQAMRANLHPQADRSIWAPNLFTLVLSPARAQRLESTPLILQELSRLLYQTGNEAGLTFPSAPVIKITAEPGMPGSDQRILAQYQLEHLTETYVMSSVAGSEQQAAPENAFLIVNGTDVFSLNGGLVNIGRKSDNQIILDDPRVSRSHAQLRYLNGHYHIFDLESTGGTFVNDRPVSQSPLYPGDVISLAGVPLIFGQEQAGDTSQTQPIAPQGPAPGRGL